MAAPRGTADDSDIQPEKRLDPTVPDFTPQQDESTHPMASHNRSEPQKSSKGTWIRFGSMEPVWIPESGPTSASKAPFKAGSDVVGNLASSENQNEGVKNRQPPAPKKKSRVKDPLVVVGDLTSSQSQHKDVENKHTPTPKKKKQESQKPPPKSVTFQSSAHQASSPQSSALDQSATNETGKDDQGKFERAT
ncbi:unnamed protein product [Discula destructiva]